MNTDCANVTCQNGGSCLFISETNNTVCVCNIGFTGNFCEGICIVHDRSLDLKLLPQICRNIHLLDINVHFGTLLLFS